MLTTLLRYSSEKYHHLLTACFSGSYGNDGPYWMDYRKDCSLFTILYTLGLRLECYLSTERWVSLVIRALVFLPDEVTYARTPETLFGCKGALRYYSF